MPSTVYNQKSHFLLVGSGTTTTYGTSNTKFVNKVFQYTLKSPETLLTQTISAVMSRNTNKVEKSGTNFDLTADSLIEKSNYFNKV